MIALVVSGVLAVVSLGVLVYGMDGRVNRELYYDATGIEISATNVEYYAFLGSVLGVIVIGVLFFALLGNARSRWRRHALHHMTTTSEIRLQGSSVWLMIASVVSGVLAVVSLGVFGYIRSLRGNRWEDLYEGIVPFGYPATTRTVGYDSYVSLFPFIETPTSEIMAGMAPFFGVVVFSGLFIVLRVIIGDRRNIAKQMQQLADWPLIFPVPAGRD